MVSKYTLNHWFTVGADMRKPRCLESRGGNSFPGKVWVSFSSDFDVFCRHKDRYGVSRFLGVDELQIGRGLVLRDNVLMR